MILIKERQLKQLIAAWHEREAFAQGGIRKWESYGPTIQDYVRGQEAKDLGELVERDFKRFQALGEENIDWRRRFREMRELDKETYEKIKKELDLTKNQVVRWSHGKIQIIGWQYEGLKQIIREWDREGKMFHD